MVLGKLTQNDHGAASLGQSVGHRLGAFAGQMIDVEIKAVELAYEGEVAQLYKAVAQQVAVRVAAKAKDFSAKFPKITVSKDT
jgi:hypothetical protein